MKTIMRNLAGTLLVAVVALGTERPQSAAQEIRLSVIRAQQPLETIYASAACQHAREAPRGHFYQTYSVYPNTFVRDLNTLMDKSDEVILAAFLGADNVISPNGKSTARYKEVRIIRSWKGSHHAGDTLTFGMPGGHVECSPSGPDESFFSAAPRGKFLTGLAQGPYVYVLFLRHAQGDETQLVQGLLPAAGEGLQGVFLINVPHLTSPSDSQRFCADVLEGNGNAQQCDSYLETMQSPVFVRYDFDPLAKRYYCMPASDFFKELQSVAAGQGSAEKSSSK